MDGSLLSLLNSRCSTGELLDWMLAEPRTLHREGLIAMRERLELQQAMCMGLQDAWCWQGHVRSGGTHDSENNAAVAADDTGPESG